MKDPFTSDKDRFLVLGSKCSLCSRLVCVGPVGKLRGLGLPSLPPSLLVAGTPHMIVGKVACEPFPRTA